MPAVPQPERRSPTPADQSCTSRMTSSSTGEPSGRLATPKTRRDEMVSPPRTSRSNSDAASATFGCSVNSGVAATYTPSLTTWLTRFNVRAARTSHDLRRSGVKHYIDAGVDPHTVMQWSGHRTESMLRRYHIIDLDDLRRAGKRASEYHGPKDNSAARVSGEPAQNPHRALRNQGRRRKRPTPWLS